MVVMVSKEVANGLAGHYVIVDWRSWKLQRGKIYAMCRKSSSFRGGGCFTLHRHVLESGVATMAGFGYPGSYEDAITAETCGRCEGVV